MGNKPMPHYEIDYMFEILNINGHISRKIYLALEKAATLLQIVLSYEQNLPKMTQETLLLWFAYPFFVNCQI